MSKQEVGRSRARCDRGGVETGEETGGEKKSATKTGKFHAEKFIFKNALTFDPSCRTLRVSIGWIHGF